MSPTPDHNSPSSCYFSFAYPASSNNTVLDTPLASPDESFDTGLITPDPTHPLLASLPPQTRTASSNHRSTRMDASKLLQLQTQAAHTQPVRPQPRPLQDVLHVSDDLSENNSDESITSVDMPLTAPDFSTESPYAHARCSRCQRTASIDMNTGRHNMVEYGLNLFYCTRCANMTGFYKR